MSFESFQKKCGFLDDFYVKETDIGKKRICHLFLSLHLG